MINNPCRNKILNNHPIIGSWIQIPDPVSAEIMTRAGFDFLAIDTEHGIMDLETVTNLLRAIESISKTVIPMVRLAGNDYSITKRYLDAGAKGIIVPFVNSNSEALEIIRSAKYYPDGERGVGFCRANNYGVDFEEYISEANENILIVAQIENIKAIENIDAIISIPLIDAVFIGPYDISASMGIPGQLNHPKMKEAISTVLNKGKKYGKTVGTHVVAPDPDEVKQSLKNGFNMIAYSLDSVMLSQMCTTGLKEIWS